MENGNIMEETVTQQEERLEPTIEPVLMREQLEEQRMALEAEKARFERQKLEDLVARELSVRGLGAEFAPYLTGESEEESLERVDKFDGLFRERLRAELQKRLRSQSAPREPERPQGYTREQLRRMSAGEINAHWAEIASVLRK
jgi:hypothetical protein